MVDAERRGGLERVAAASELKNNGAAAVDCRYGVVMEDGQQVAQPVCGRQGLEQAGFARHGRSLITGQAKCAAPASNPLKNQGVSGASGPRA